MQQSVQVPVRGEERLVNTLGTSVFLVAWRLKAPQSWPMDRKHLH